MYIEASEESLFHTDSNEKLIEKYETTLFENVILGTILCKTFHFCDDSSKMGIFKLQNHLDTLALLKNIRFVIDMAKVSI